MFELVALGLFVAIPWALGYVSASYLAALLPAASLIVALVVLVGDPPEATDEVDALPGLWTAFSFVAVLVCLMAAALRRRTDRRT